VYSVLDKAYIVIDGNEYNFISDPEMRRMIEKSEEEISAYKEIENILNH